MSIELIAEIGTMAFLGICLKKLGWRYTMVLGNFGAHGDRFGIFAALAPWLGWRSRSTCCTVSATRSSSRRCTSSSMNFFPKDARSSAQGLFNFLILGFGPFIANFIWPELGAMFKNGDGSVNFRMLFLVPSGTRCSSQPFLLLLFFHPPEKATPDISGKH